MYFNLGNHTKYGQDTYAYNLAGNDPLTHQFKYSASMYTKLLLLNTAFKPILGGGFYNYNELSTVLAFKFGKPSSYKITNGTAIKTWDSTSGGVITAATTNAPTIT